MGQERFSEAVLAPGVLLQDENVLASSFSYKPNVVSEPITGLRREGAHLICCLPYALVVHSDAQGS